MKILLLKPSSLGDVVHAIPVLRLLKLHYPQSRIYWWLEGSLVPLLEGDPDLEGIIPFHRRRWGSLWNWPEMLRSLRLLRRHQFDLVLDLQSLARSGVFAWLTNGSFTLGLHDMREAAPLFHDASVARPSFHTHAVDWYLALLTHLRIPVQRDFVWMPPRPGVRAAMEQKWPAVSRQRWILLNPGARWLNKRWPVEHFQQLLQLLAQAYPRHHFAVLGAREDQEMGRAIAAALPERCLDLTGRTTLPEVVEWIRGGDLTITNDTGPMHLAAALGKPVVALFGPTEPARTGPYGRQVLVLQEPLPCAPCMKDRCHNPAPLECLRAIAPLRVLQEIRRRFVLDPVE